MKCINCAKEFEPKRKTAQYCSTTCRVAHNRVSVTKVSVTKPVTLKKSENVTLKTAKDVTLKKEIDSKPKVSDNWSVGDDVKCLSCGGSNLSLTRPRSFGGVDRNFWNNGKDKKGVIKKKEVIDYTNITCAKCGNLEEYMPAYLKTL